MQLYQKLNGIRSPRISYSQRSTRSETARRLLYAACAVLSIVFVWYNYDFHANHHVDGAARSERGGYGFVSSLSARSSWRMVLLPAFLYPSIELPDNYLHYTANETMLRHIVMECIKRQSTTVFINTRGKLAVQDMTAAYENCPPLDIMLGASERGIGMCTDVALYVLHAGARLIPRVPVGVYNGFCRQQTARLFLETVYEEWLQNTTGIRTVMLPNFENFYEGGIDQHRQMKEIICKHRTCEALMKQYVLDKSLPAKVTYMGHTSMDPSVGHESAARSVSQLLHVKGKSPHKYTTELLQCYANRPNYPPLTVVGQATVPELSWVSSDQVSFVPKPNERTWDGNLGGAQAGRSVCCRGQRGDDLLLVSYSAADLLANCSGLWWCAEANFMCLCALKGSTQAGKQPQDNRPIKL